MVPENRQPFALQAEQFRLCSAAPAHQNATAPKRWLELLSLMSSENIVASLMSSLRSWAQSLGGLKLLGA
jgi:hypothetical protein